ncbi:MAG TPA: CPBP family intramembrane glutamic endopeptidase [Candidatus Dormibacteraeota bacterium]|nr:CPBP family intramembrane glutamic endopeptidase [Candidatus Dormibacteraeota bacterium]
MISAARRRPAARAALVGAYVLAVEWTRALAMRSTELTVAALLLGGVALALVAWGWPAEQLGLGTSRLGLRLLGGLALGAVLLLPTAVRAAAAPILPASFALAAVAVSVGEEVAFRGALYAALDEIGGAPVAVVGSTLLWTLAHALSHPPAFLGAVAAAGLLLSLWRWACKDLVGPIVAHVIADIAL